MDIESFIEQSRCAGELESEGSFDIDSFGALRKTLSSSLPEHHYYLFQIVQGLVRARADDIKVAIGRQGTKFSFRDTHGVFTDRDDLLARLNGTLRLSTNKAKGLLVSGIATALGSDVNKATLWGGGANKALRLAIGEASVVTTNAPPQYTLIDLRRAPNQNTSFNWSRIWGARKEEFRLRKRFEQSPRKINIAGLRTAPSSLWRREVAAAGAAGPVVLLEAALLADGDPNHCGEDPGWVTPITGRNDLYGNSPIEPEFEDHEDDDDEHEEEALAEDVFLLALNSQGDPVSSPLEKDDWFSRSWTFCFTSNQGPSQAFFVRNGYQFGPHDCDLGFPGLRVIVPSDDLAVDASGYALVENSAFEARLEQARGLAKKVSTQLTQADLRSHYQKVRNSKDPDSDIAALIEAFPWLS